MKCTFLDTSDDWMPKGWTILAGGNILMVAWLLPTLVILMYTPYRGLVVTAWYFLNSEPAGGLEVTGHGYDCGNNYTVYTDTLSHIMVMGY